MAGTTSTDPDPVTVARAAFASGRTRSLTWRRAQLEGLVRMLAERGDDIRAAMAADLGKSDVEATLTEISTVSGEAKLALKNLRRWTADRRVRAPLTLGTARATIHREPLGTVLIIGPWNYPFHLLFMPLVGALAAGNAVVLKPSEVAPACSKVVADIVPRYLDTEAVQVVEGGVEETTRLLDGMFDHIFYTGNGPVGSIVMAAAARRLTPVTLELGGKSPVWVDSSLPVERVAGSLAWGKFANCGQTCVAPDYVLTTPELAEPLAAALGAAVRASYGEDPLHSEYYGRIVNERHAARLAALLPSGRAVVGGTAEASARYVAPTVLLDVAADSPVMQDEIFGPILPIVTVADHDAAIDFINERPKPLALYAYTNRAEVREAIIARTSSGGVAFNTVMTQLGVPALPFGGVGPSGMGSYHGERSLVTFSHERSILRKLPGPDLTTMARPPFNPRMRKMLLRG
ncbi:aldehyde dehydrogenase family protein [Nocardia sp. alder85J]|uniref:aldehyde dehydrogenase family protein n=1 Tax=Nocardia sp. alder85J TaxID=2862949 RepID=UPI001CD1DCA4|nr:aldehyde dehydrogenase family protein [Nocardia sp. alder85J]MCX4090993.1 aldehyde dehydrogenase family protein [Nocardia sp. alder85J]